MKGIPHPKNENSTTCKISYLPHFLNNKAKTVKHESELSNLLNVWKNDECKNYFQHA